MKEVNGTNYDDTVSDNLIALLEKLRQSKERVIFVYNQGMGTERGTVGRSTGTSKILLLVKTKRSMGGFPLMEKFLVEVRDLKGKTLFINE